ncbi:DUF4411 family protein [bacterium]|nr:MAG: DUF4411 family protein [bacterium]
MSMLVVDSNFFIQAHRSTYPLDVAKSFWQKVSELAHNGKICSIDKVKSELFTNNDLLTEWCQENLPDNFFVDSSPVINSYRIVIQTATARIPAYNQRALDTFFDAEEADAWLIAHGLFSSLSIVTHETSEPQKINRVKIPDICNLLNIRTLTTIQMFRELGESF